MKYLFLLLFPFALMSKNHHDFNHKHAFFLFKCWRVCEDSMVWT